MRPVRRKYLVCALLSVSLIASVFATAGGAVATAGGKGHGFDRAFRDPRSGAALNRDVALKVGGGAGESTGDATTRIHPIAVNNGTGAFYLSTLGFSSANAIQVFKSTDGGQTFGAPVNGAPGIASGDLDKEWMTVDNFAGTGQHNIYLCFTNFGGVENIMFTSSTDAGATFPPSGGTLISTGGQGCYAAVGPDHSVYVFYYRGTGGGGQGGDNK